MKKLSCMVALWLMIGAQACESDSAAGDRIDLPQELGQQDVTVDTAEEVQGGLPEVGCEDASTQDLWASNGCEPESVTMGLDGSYVCDPLHVLGAPVAVIWSDVGHTAALNDTVVVSGTKSYSCIGAEIVEWQWSHKKPDGELDWPDEAVEAEWEVVLDTPGHHEFRLIVRDSKNHLTCRHAWYIIAVE